MVPNWSICWGKGGRGRRKPSKPEPETVFEKVLEAPLQLERKAFLEAADKFYLNSAIEAFFSQAEIGCCRRRRQCCLRISITR